MKLKQAIRVVLFLAVFCILFIAVSRIFSIPESHMLKRFNTFYEEAPDTLDAVYIGSSSVDRYWASPLAWGENGIAVYPLSTNVQPIAAARYLIEETLKTQSPKLFIIDVRGARTETVTDTEAIIRNVTDHMRPSITRIKAINALMEFKGVDSSERLDYYFSISKYHGLWEDGMTEEDFGPTYSTYKGMYMRDSQSAKVQPFDYVPEMTEERGKLEESVKTTLVELMNYCREIKVNVLFVASPYIIDTDERRHLNAIADLISREGFHFIDFNAMTEELGIDFSKDFYNEWHVNLYGSYKYTRWLAPYLAENYLLEDKRGETVYSSWDTAYDEFLIKVRKLTKKKLK